MTVAAAAEFNDNTATPIVPAPMAAPRTKKPPKKRAKMLPTWIAFA
jgi:hypothetical protein